MSFFDKRSSLMTVSDYRLLAKKRLPQYLFDFIEGGAFLEKTKRKNEEDFQGITLCKRVLKDVSNIDTAVEVLGENLSQPLVLAPVGFAGMYARRGEVQAAFAAQKAGIPFTLSPLSLCSMDEVHASTKVPFWYQFYMLKERGLALELLNCAKACGCRVLVLTVDLPGVGIRHRYNQSLPPNWFKQKLDHFLHTNWYIDVCLRGGALVLGDVAQLIPHLKDFISQRKWMGSQLDPTLTWKDLEWVRKNWSGKIVLKGILCAEDAYLTCESGMDGLIVSNHGGRHMDGIPSAISVLPEVASVVDRRLDVLVDGGIQSGLDVARALALGAKACLIGRAWAFALAAHGEEGVSGLTSLFKEELKSVMAQVGAKAIKDLDSQVLHRSGL